MYEKFTDRARRVVVVANEEARLLCHTYVGTEHILLALMHDDMGSAARALESLGLTIEAVRQTVEEILGQGGQAPTGHIPYTPRAKKVFELSVREAMQREQKNVSTEHILFGLIREGEGWAAQTIVKLGVDLSTAKKRLNDILEAVDESKQTGVLLRVNGVPVLLAPITAERLRDATRLAWTAHQPLGPQHIGDAMNK